MHLLVIFFNFYCAFIALLVFGPRKLSELFTIAVKQIFSRQIGREMHHVGWDSSNLLDLHGAE